MNLKLGGYELEAGRSGSGLGSYYSKLEMSALLLCAVLKNSYFRRWPQKTSCESRPGHL